jgi:hypothetical protein
MVIEVIALSASALAVLVSLIVSTIVTLVMGEGVSP